MPTCMITCRNKFLFSRWRFRWTISDDKCLDVNCCKNVVQELKGTRRHTVTAFFDDIFKGERKATHIVDWAARERDVLGCLFLNRFFQINSRRIESRLRFRWSQIMRLQSCCTRIVPQEAARSRFRKSKTTIRTNRNVQSDFRRVSWFHKYKLTIHKV